MQRASASLQIPVRSEDGDTCLCNTGKKKENERVTVGSSLGLKFSVWSLSSPSSLPPSPSSVPLLCLLIFSCPTASSQPSFLVSLHTTDWSLFLLTLLPVAQHQCSVQRADLLRRPDRATRLPETSEPWSLEVHSCLFFSLSTLPSFFGTCFSSFFCYVRQTEVEQASKWMAKPSFPLLALLFMHVISVPAPSLFSLLFLSILVSVFSLLHPFSLLSIYSIFFCQMVQLLNFHTILCTVYILYVEFLFKMTSPDLVTAKQRWQWQGEEDESTVSGSTEPLEKQVSLIMSTTWSCLSLLYQT